MKAMLSKKDLSQLSDRIVKHNPLHIACLDVKHPLIMNQIETLKGFKTIGNLMNIAIIKMTWKLNIDLNTIKFLVDYKCDLNAIDQSNHTPLSYACSGNTKLEIIEFLVENKADPYIDLTSGTPLNHALANQNLVKEIEEKYFFGAKEFFEKFYNK